MSVLISSSKSTIHPDTNSANVARGVGFAIIGQILGRGIHLISQVIIARWLGPAGYGLYGIGWTLTRILGILSHLGLDNGIIFFLSPYTGKYTNQVKAVLIQCLTIATISGFAVSGLLYIIAPFLATVFHEPELVTALRILSPVFVPIALLRVITGAIRARHRIDYAIRGDDLGQPLLNLVLVVLLYIAGYKLNGAITALVLSFLLAAAIAAYYMRQVYVEVLQLSTLNTLRTSTILKYSIPTCFAALLGISIIWIDRLMISHFSNANAAGIYQAISQISLLFAVVLTGLNSTLGSLTSSALQEQDFANVNEIFTVCTKWGAYLCFPLCLVLCLQAKQIIGILFGSEYVSGAIPLIILALTQYFNVATGGVNILLILSGNQKIWLTISSIMLIIDIGLNWFLIPRYGLTGAAITTAIVIVAQFTTGLLILKQRLNLWPYDQRYYKGISSAIVTTLFVVLLTRWEFYSPLVQLSTIATASVLIFFSMLFILKLDEEDKQFVSNLKNRGVAYDK